MRRETGFNDGWKFFLGDAPDGESAALEDSEWQSVTLPHDWSIAQAFSPDYASATGFLPGGVGWYRKRFMTPDLEAGDDLSILFDGIYCNSEIWLNGQRIGGRPNGFVSFSVSLTPYLLQNAENLLAVRVDHTRFADARWYTGSGINRKATLIQTGPVHFAQWGIALTTPSVSQAIASVTSEIAVVNSHSHAIEAVIRQTLFDAMQKSLCQSEKTIVLPGRTESTIAMAHTLQNPSLWSPENPDLYTARTEILLDAQAIDQIDTPFGVRSIRFDPNEGFFLNDQNIKLKGVCIHDDAGALGTAVPPDVWKRRLSTLKEAGVNAIRMAHNPHMPEVYDLCDQLGFLVQDEAFDEWELGKRKWIKGWNVGEAGTDGPSGHFDKWSGADLRDTVLRDRNHPSIIMWSIGNEIDYPNDPYTHEVLDDKANPQASWARFVPERPHAARLGEIAQLLAATVKSIDTTRPVTAALAAVNMANETSFPDALDVVGYNYQESLYAAEHAKYPDRILYGSENGMWESFWNAVADNTYISGQFLWTGIDYLGEAGQWPARSNGAGLLDLAGFPKPEYYFRQSLWSQKPIVYLGVSTIPQTDEPSSLWSHKQAEPNWQGRVGELLRVSCFTNCLEGELSINDRIISRKSRDVNREHILQWDIPYEIGTLRVCGLNGDVIIASQELHTYGAAVKLQIASDKAALKLRDGEIAHVTVTALDENNHLVYSANDTVQWTISGPIKLLGLENGDHASHEPYQEPRRRLYHGRQLGYLQSFGRPGQARNSVAADGLQSAELTIDVALSP